MKRILVCVDSFEVGGVTSVVMNLYRNIDKSRYSMDFIAVRKLENEFEREIVNNGDGIFFINVRKLSKIPVLNYSFRTNKVCKQICGLIHKGEYAAAHIHSHAAFYLPAAKKLEIPVRIYQSHEGISDFNGNEKKSKLTAFIWKKRVRMYNMLATVKAGDSKKACVAKFGAEVINDQKMEVIHPPVDMEKFNPTHYSRDEIIKEFNIDATAFNMIHVGRLSHVKNQSFMIDVLAEINKTRQAELYIVGDGELKQKLIEYAGNLKMGNNVHFLPGNTTPGIYRVMDCSLLPSFSEAFGMVAVESQVMGVPCFASDNVPEDVDIGMCSFLELDTKKWADGILEYDYDEASADREKQDKFTIEAIVKQVSELYENQNNI